MKRFLWFGAVLAGLAVVITLGTESRAIAQVVRAALVRNQDEPGRNPYFESKHTVCSSQGCVIVFSPVPAGQRLVLTFVSAECCEYGPPPKIVQLIKPNVESQGFPMIASDDITAYTSSPVVAYFEAGETPAMAAFPPDGGGGLEGTLSGYFVSLP
ncbi:MAG TPA: hypothetical protein VFW44_07115 [Bryobacteraceae bacterium]|nr:hypothetical protein [Bryobacteraceae bacterium]